MKCLITGGAGFIGSHIAEELCSRGHSVIIVDDLSTGDPVNLAWRQPRHQLELVQSCITDTALIRKAMEGCDWVFHHAAVASVPYSVEHPLQTHAINLTASLNLFHAARELAVKRVIFASSSAVYGDSAPSPAPETAPVNPISPYGLQKYAAERYGQLFHQLYGLEVVSFRYFNVFGPRQSDSSPYSGVIAKFCHALKRGQPPTIFGDGSQTRDFVFVKNVVAANLLAAEAPAAKVAGQVFNIGTGTPTTLAELYAALQSVSSIHLEPQFGPPRHGDIQHSRASVAKAASVLPGFLGVSFESGLEQTWGFYQ